MDFKNLTNDEYKKIVKRVAFYKRKYGNLLIDMSEHDLANEVILKYLKNGTTKQTIKQAIIDIIRSKHGRSRGGHDNPRGNFKIQYQQTNDRDEFNYINRGTETNGRDHFEDSKNLRIADKIVFDLYFIWGFSLLELANLFKKTESRMSQKLKDIVQKLNKKEERKSFEWIKI